MKHLKIIAIALIFTACNLERHSAELKAEEETKINIEAELKLIEKLRSEFCLAIKEGRYQDIGKLATKNAKSIRAGGLGFEEMFAIGKERGMFPYDSIIMTPTETQEN